MFPDFRRAWFFGGGRRERRLSGLARRLDFLCRTTDAAEIASLKTANNDTEARALFHLAFQYMLATGAFDDLAALADDVYSLNLRKHERTLRLPRKGESRAMKLIGQHNSSLAEFVSSDRTTKAIESFYPIRDALQHREFPYTVAMASSRSARLPSVLAVPRKAVEELAEAVQDASPPIRPWIDDEGLATVDLTWLARRPPERSPASSTASCSMSHRDMATEPSRREGDVLWERFSAGPASFLGWGGEPVFFRRWKAGRVVTSDNIPTRAPFRMRSLSDEDSILTELGGLFLAACTERTFRDVAGAGRPVQLWSEPHARHPPPTPQPPPYTRPRRRGLRGCHRRS